jgi:hypothetical protein
MLYIWERIVIGVGAVLAVALVALAVVLLAWPATPRRLPALTASTAPAEIENARYVRWGRSFANKFTASCVDIGDAYGYEMFATEHNGLRVRVLFTNREAGW